jgi:hypothetical protein
MTLVTLLLVSISLKMKMNPLSRILTPKLPVRSQWDFSSLAPNELSCKICLLATAKVPSGPLISKKKLKEVDAVVCFGGYYSPA